MNNTTTTTVVYRVAGFAGRITLWPLSTHDRPTVGAVGYINPSEVAVAMFPSNTTNPAKATFISVRGEVGMMVFDPIRGSPWLIPLETSP